MVLKTNVKRLEIKDKEVVKSMLSAYLDDEPLSNHLRLSQQDKDIYIQTSQTVLSQGVSMGIYDSHTGEMCAVGLVSLPNNRVLMEDYKKLAEKSQQSCSTKLMQMLRFEDSMDRAAASIFGSKTFVEMSVVYIKQKYQKLHLVDKYTEWCIKIAKEHGCDGVISVATSHYSERTLQRHGYVPVKRVFYKDYKDPVSGEAVFAEVPPPHNCCVIYIKTMRKESKL